MLWCLMEVTHAGVFPTIVYYNVSFMMWTWVIVARIDLWRDKIVAMSKGAAEECSDGSVKGVGVNVTAELEALHDAWASPLRRLNEETSTISTLNCVAMLLGSIFLLFTAVRGDYKGLLEVAWLGPLGLLFTFFFSLLTLACLISFLHALACVGDAHARARMELARPSVVAFLQRNDLAEYLSQPAVAGLWMGGSIVTSGQVFSTCALVFLTTISALFG